MADKRNKCLTVLETKGSFNSEFRSNTRVRPTLIHVQQLASQQSLTGLLERKERKEETDDKKWINRKEIEAKRMITNGRRKKRSNVRERQIEKVRKRKRETKITSVWTVKSSQQHQFGDLRQHRKWCFVLHEVNPEDQGDPSPTAPTQPLPTCLQQLQY